MKLANFFLMTMLVGTLGVLGCSDDTTNTAGTGGSGTAGSGGSGTASNCDYGDCADPGDQRVACETAVGICESTLPPGTAQDVCVEGANVDACGLR